MNGDGMTGGGFSVCVIVPAFNEAGTIADVVRGARGVRARGRCGGGR